MWRGGIGIEWSLIRAPALTSDRSVMWRGGRADQRDASPVYGPSATCSRALTSAAVDSPELGVQLPDEAAPAAGTREIERRAHPSASRKNRWRARRNEEHGIRARGRRPSWNERSDPRQSFASPAGRQPKRPFRGSTPPPTSAPVPAGGSDRQPIAVIAASPDG
jgi:hypothetical protein